MRCKTSGWSTKFYPPILFGVYRSFGTLDAKTADLSGKLIGLEWIIHANSLRQTWLYHRLESASFSCPEWPRNQHLYN